MPTSMPVRSLWTMVLFMLASPVQAQEQDAAARFGAVGAIDSISLSPDGGQIAFAFLMNEVYPSSAKVLQDRMAGVLARYSG